MRLLVALVIVGGLDTVALADRLTLPGFSIDTPPGEVIEQPDERYGQGEITFGDMTEGNHMLFSIAWEAGDLLSDGDLRDVGTSLGVDLGKKHRRTLVSIDGPGGVDARTVVLTTKRGQLELSQVACGKRRVTVMTGGKPPAKAIHRQLVASIECEPQASLEAAAGDLAVIVELPGWHEVSNTGGVVILGDGRSLIALRTLTGATAKDAAESTAELADVQGWNIELGTTTDDLTRLHGTITGASVQGFVKLMTCPRGNGNVVAIALTPSKSAATKLATRLATYRCRADDEPVQVFPKKSRRRHRK